MYIIINTHTHTHTHTHTWGPAASYPAPGGTDGASRAATSSAAASFGRWSFNVCVLDKCGSPIPCHLHNMHTHTHTHKHTHTHTQTRAYVTQVHSVGICLK